MAGGNKRRLIPSLVLLFFSILLNTKIVLPQQQHIYTKVSKPAGQVAAGLYIGYARNLVDQRIGSYALPGCFIELPISDRWKLQSGFEYYQSSYEGISSVYEYNGLRYYGSLMQTWRDIALKIATQYRVSNISSVGISVSVDKIYIKQIRPKEEGFVIDSFNDKVYYYSETITDNIISPGLSFFATMDILKESAFTPFLFVEYKLTFVGKKYGKTPLNSQNNFLISGGVKYQL